jgi:hypothetical protein
LTTDEPEIVIALPQAYATPPRVTWGARVRLLTEISRMVRFDAVEQLKNIKPPFGLLVET